MIKEYIIFNFKKSLKYKTNLLSWFIADISLYFSVFFTYSILLNENNLYFGMTKDKVLLYVSTYTLSNNIFAIFFSEGVSTYANSLENGDIIYDLLAPLEVIKVNELFNLNVPAILISPLLFIINIKLVYINNLLTIYIFIYYISMFLSAICLKYIFLSIYNFKMLRIRTDSIGSLVVNLLEFAEKPRKVFPDEVGKIFTFLIPIFAMSYIPYELLVSRKLIWFIILIILNILWFVIFEMLFNSCRLYYDVDIF